jgi:dihydrofolate reductase
LADDGRGRGRLRGQDEHASEVRRVHDIATADWNNSTIIRDNVPEQVAELKQQPGADILIGGSATLAKTLIEHDLIDEIRMLIHPFCVGTGTRLFDGGTESIGLRLAETPRTFESGVVALTYRSA